MLAKLVMIVVALGLTAASLLAVRQQRLQAVSEMATAIERASSLDRRTWRARVDISRRVSPEALGRALGDLEALEPIRVEWCEFVGLGEGVEDGAEEDEGGEGVWAHGG